MNYYTPITSYFFSAKSKFYDQLNLYKAKCQSWFDSKRQSIWYQSAIFIIVPVLILGLFISISYLRGSRVDHSKDISVSYGNQQSSGSSVPITNQSKGNIKVDISGAVKDPGVKLLDSDARVNDALLAAGGYSDQADQQFLAQALNLAQKLNDGDKIFIPSMGQTVAATTTAAVNIVNPTTATQKPLVNNEVATTTKPTTINSTTGTKAATPSPTNTGPININSASLTELESLPGIGPVYAQDIISGRPYTDTQQLCTQKVIKNSTTCQKIQSLITL